MSTSIPTTLLLGCSMVFAISCSCEKYNEAKDAISAVKNLKETAENVQESMDQANDRMEERRKKGDTLAIHYEELATYLPESFSGYEKSGDLEGGTTNTPGYGSYSNVMQRYINSDGNQVTINIVDYNAAAMMYSTIMAAYASGFEIDNTDQHIKGFELSQDVKGWTVYHKKSRRAEAYAGVADRFHISVEADEQDNIDMVKNVTTKSIPVEKLAKL